MVKNEKRIAKQKENVVAVVHRATNTKVNRKNRRKKKNLNRRRKNRIRKRNQLDIVLHHRRREKLNFHTYFVQNPFFYIKNISSNSNVYMK